MLKQKRSQDEIIFNALGIYGLNEDMMKFMINLGSLPVEIHQKDFNNSGLVQYVIVGKKYDDNKYMDIDSIDELEKISSIIETFAEKRAYDGVCISY